MQSGRSLCRPTALNTSDRQFAGAVRSPVATGGPILNLDLDREIEQLHAEPAWATGRNAKTLVRHDDFRVVLVTMRSGNRMHSHQAPATVSIQTLRGKVELSVMGESFEVAEGGLISLDPRVVHDVVAVDDSAILLTIAWRTNRDEHGQA